METGESGRWEREAEEATGGSAEGSGDPREQVGTGEEDTGDAAFATQEGSAVAGGPGAVSSDPAGDSNLEDNEGPEEVDTESR